MTVKILFKQFQDSLRSRAISPESVSLYIEWDDDSAEQKLKFKSEAFLDEVPDNFDLDEEIYHYLRDLDDSQEAEFEELKFKKRPRVVAEGDSWYNLPFFIRPFAIADWMKEHKRLKVKNIARWGHTLAQILEQDEYISAIEQYKPQYFMICGGGNDIKNSLAKGNLFHSYTADRNVDNYLTDEGIALIEYIGDGLLSSCPPFISISFLDNLQA